MLGVLYSFRRCPYAMRARLALAYCLTDQCVELREVVLKDKPQRMLDISPKGTVPVLRLNDGEVVEESIEIMHLALAHNVEKGLQIYPPLLRSQIDEFITMNDGDFKWALDHYKYADRYEESEAFYRMKGEVFLGQLNLQLSKHKNLFSDDASLADLAIFPFVRQFAHVNKAWFENSEYTHLNRWLSHWLDSALFAAIMFKYKQWQPCNEPVYFP